MYEKIGVLDNEFSQETSIYTANIGINLFDIQLFGRKFRNRFYLPYLSAIYYVDFKWVLS